MKANIFEIKCGPSEQVEKIIILGESLFSLIVLKHGSPFGIPHVVKKVCTKSEENNSTKISRYVQVS
jgi:hypothetical protein